MLKRIISLLYAIFICVFSMARSNYVSLNQISSNKPQKFFLFCIHKSNTRKCILHIFCSHFLHSTDIESHQETPKSLIWGNEKLSNVIESETEPKYLIFLSPLFIKRILFTCVPFTAINSREAPSRFLMLCTITYLSLGF